MYFYKQIVQFFHSLTSGCEKTDLLEKNRFFRCVLFYKTTLPYSQILADNGLKKLGKITR
jgi:hypothetical protein